MVRPRPMPRAAVRKKPGHGKIKGKGEGVQRTSSSACD